MRLCRFDILCDGVLGGAPGAFHGGVLGGVPGGAPDGEDEQEGCGSCLCVERWCETQEGDAMTLSSATPKIHSKVLLF